MYFAMVLFVSQKKYVFWGSIFGAENCDVFGWYFYMIFLGVLERYFGAAANFLRCFGTVFLVRRRFFKVFWDGIFARRRRFY